MQTWHCIAFLFLSVGIFFYATYLRDVEKNTELSLEDLSSIEKQLGIAEITKDENQSFITDGIKKSNWVEQALTLTSKIKKPFVLNYHVEALRGEVFIEYLLSKLNENPNAKNLILGAFTSELFGHNEKDIIKSLFYLRRETETKAQIVCKGHTERASALLCELILRSYKKCIAVEANQRPLLPSQLNKLEDIRELEGEASKIKVYISSMLEESPSDSIEAMALRSEILQVELEIRELKNSLIEIDSVHKEARKNPKDFLEIKAISEYGKINEFSLIFSKLERMAKDNSLNELTRNEVMKNLQTTKENFHNEVISAIDSIKDKVQVLLSQKSSLQKELAEHIISQKKSLSQNPKTRRLHQIRDELAKIQKSYDDENLRWMSSKKAYEMIYNP
jgi:hypothetical protein